jgi:DNA invertase Pin-like site-specific DNA recombinase
VKIGYARTSTLEQVAGFEAQVKELKALGCERILKEQVSSIAARPQLERALDSLRKGDVLIVTKLDRLARNVVHLGQIVDRVQTAGASLRIVSMGLDTGTATGKLMLNVMGSVAQFEREMMLERQREGIARAKAEGKYRGGKRSFSDERLAALQASGMSMSAIARELGVTRQALYKRIGDRSSV